jgi:hypothetical protein
LILSPRALVSPKAVWLAFASDPRDVRLRLTFAVGNARTRRELGASLLLPWRAARIARGRGRHAARHVVRSALSPSQFISYLRDCGSVRAVSTGHAAGRLVTFGSGPRAELCRQAKPSAQLVRRAHGVGGARFLLG